METVEPNVKGKVYKTFYNQPNDSVTIVEHFVKMYRHLKSMGV